MNLGRGTPLRAVLISVGVAGAVLAVTQLVLPGSPGSAGRGTPTALLFTGLVSGSLTAMTAIGLVLIYRTSRIINFAQAALGTTGAIFAYNLVVAHRVPYGLAFAAAIVVSALVALFFELLVLRRFFEAPRLVLTIVTIGLGSLLAQFGTGLIGSLAIWGDERGIIEQFGVRPISPIPGFEFRLGDVQIPFGFAHLLTLGVLVVALFAVGGFLKFTRLGTAVRASSENAERAELLGVNVKILQTVVWVIAAGLAGAALTLQGTMQTFALAGQGAPGVLIAALAAAVVARMRSITVAAFASILIAVLQSAVGWSYQGHGGVVQAGLFLVIVIGLLAQRRTLQRAEEGSSWKANEEVRPTPRELLAIPSIRTWRWGLIVAAGIFVVGFPWTVESGLTNRGAFAAIIAIVLVSLVVLTGWAGQVSLGQFAFVAIAAMVGGALTARADLSFWLALPIAAVLTSITALIVGLPALRIRGLFLAVVTLAFASSVSILLFDSRYFGWLEPANIRRPTLPFIDFEDERSMYYLSVVFLGLAILLVATLRRSRPGRVLIALRENENDLQAFGINVVRTKLAAFALSGFICGVAGVLFAHHQRAISPTAFTPQASVDLIVFAIIGGIGSVTGALLGSAYQAAVQIFPATEPVLAVFLSPEFGLLVILFIAPGGLASIAYAIRDSIYRIVAQRRQIIVPSLMADFDPSVLEKQLVPLGDRAPDAGLAALGERSHYQLDSSLYQGTETGEDGGRRAPDERSALGAAAERAAAED